MTGPVFGDAEPEDAWDADDPAGVQVDNLRRRLALLGELLERDDEATLAEMVEAIAARLDAVRERSEPFTVRDLTRIRQLADDLVHVRRRLAGAS